MKNIIPTIRTAFSEIGNQDYNPILTFKDNATSHRYLEYKLWLEADKEKKYKIIIGKNFGELFYGTELIKRIEI